VSPSPSQDPSVSPAASPETTPRPAGRETATRVVVPALAIPSPINHEQFLAELVAEGISVKSDGVVDIFQLNGVEVHCVVKRSGPSKWKVARCMWPSSGVSRPVASRNSKAIVSPTISCACMRGCGLPDVS